MGSRNGQVVRAILSEGNWGQGIAGIGVSLLYQIKIRLLMEDVSYDSPTKTSKNLFRGRSLSSLASRQFSVMEVVKKRESVIANEGRKQEEEKTAALLKETEISRLKKNLETAMSTALYQKIENSKSREEIASQLHHKRYLEGKIKLLERENKAFREEIEQKESSLHQLEDNVALQKVECCKLQGRLQEKVAELQAKQVLEEELFQCKTLLKSIDPLKSRIMVLEEQVRGEKMKRQEVEVKWGQGEKEKELLRLEIARTRPREQELKERIAYFQRVNLDLQRKMEDYNRRENDYIKTITSLKNNLTKVTADRNHFKTVYQETEEQLKVKVEDYNQLAGKFEHKLETIRNLEKDLLEEREVGRSLRTEIEGKIEFYREQGEQNKYLTHRNKMLQEIELELRQVIQHHVKVAEEVNVIIVQRCEEIRRLKGTIDSYKSQIEETEKKFERFDKLMQEGSEKSYNQVRESFYTILRLNNEYVTSIKESQISFNEKLMVLGEERDILNRSKVIRSLGVPSDQNQYQSIFHEKTEAILLLQNSNDQLLKVKKDLEGKIEELEGLLENEKKEMMALKIKTADMFKAKKELEEARKKMDRYQEMIQEQNDAAADLQAQLDILRGKNAEMNEKFFMLEMDKRNLEVKLKETDEIIKELDVEVLQTKKNTNEKNSHLIVDSMQKLESAVKSLSFFFNCAFCGQLPLSPVTLALCGHNYCAKCKDAYSESCYECDTGMPIEKVFQNRFLKDASGKYKFLTMVLAELKANFLLL